MIADPSTPRDQSRFTDADIARFWSKVDWNGDCWLWQAATGWGGYGRFVVYIDGRKVTLYAHRVAYEITFGPIKNGLYVLHSCDNPRCVNPDHLSLGTQKKNLQDAARRGRTSNQYMQAKNELTWDQVCEIRRRYEIGGENQINLAAEYGLAVGYVNRLCRYLVRTAPPRISPEVEFAIHIAARRSTDVKAIAEIFGIHPNTVRRILKRKPRPLATAEERAAYNAA